NASKSSSVSVRSSGWIATSMATDFLSSPSDAPSKISNTRTSVISFLSAEAAARVSVAASTDLSTTNAKSRRTAWNDDRSSFGLVRVGLALASGTASMNTSKPHSGPETSSASSVFGWNSPKVPSTTLGPSLIVPERPGWYQAGPPASTCSLSTGAPAASNAANASALASNTPTDAALPAQ